MIIFYNMFIIHKITKNCKIISKLLEIKILWSATNSNLKNIVGKTDRNWYFKNPDTVLQYEKAATSSSKGNTIVKNQHQYYYKYGASYKIGDIVSGNVGVKNENTTSIFYWSTLPTNQFAGNEVCTQIGDTPSAAITISMIKGANANWNGANEGTQFTVIDTDAISFLNNYVFNNTSYYTDTRTTVTKALSDCPSVSSTASFTQKKYITDETASITQMNLQGAMFPQVLAQYDTTTAKTYALSSSLSSNSLTSSSAIPYKSWSSEPTTYTSEITWYSLHSNLDIYRLISKFYKNYTVSETIATAIPDNMISETTTAKIYADGNGSKLQNGIYYNVNGGYAKNCIYVATGKASSSILTTNGNYFELRPEFVAPAQLGHNSQSTTVVLFHVKNRDEQNYMI